MSKFTKTGKRYGILSLKMPLEMTSDNSFNIKYVELFLVKWVDLEITGK
jgi:hypothetical protein